MQKIESGNGDLTERIPEKTQDEVGQMVRGINKFIIQLQTIMRKLKDEADTLMDSARKVGTQLADSNQDAFLVLARNIIHNTVNRHTKPQHDRLNL